MRTTGKQFAKSIAEDEMGLVWIEGSGLFFKVGNPQRNSRLSAVPKDHIKTVRSYLRKLLGRPATSRVGGEFLPCRARFSAFDADNPKGRWRVLAHSWADHDRTKGASYGILWRPPVTIIVK